jgi:hypothetical protein
MVKTNMTAKRAKGFSDMNLDNVGKVIDIAIKPNNIKKTGRPKKNPFDEDKKLTIRVPGNIHRQLRFAAVDLDKPMVEIVVDALIKHLKSYEGR